MQFTRVCASLLSTMSVHPGPCLNTRMHHCAVAVMVQMRDCVYTINSPREVTQMHRIDVFFISYRQYRKKISNHLGFEFDSIRDSVMDIPS